MKVTIESTTQIVNVNGIGCRVWEGQTESGVKVQCLIPRISVMNGQDVSQFEAELKECATPSSDALQCYPLRMVL